MKTIKIGFLALCLTALMPALSLALPDDTKPLISMSSQIGTGYTNPCVSLRNNGGTCYWYAASGSGTISSGLFGVSGRTRVCMDTLSGNGTNQGSIQVNQMIGPKSSGTDKYFVTPTSATLDGTDCIFLYTGNYWLEATQGLVRIAVELTEVRE